MKKEVNTKNNIIIIILCLTIIFMSIGYIIISTNKKTKEDYSYNVVFSDVIKKSIVKGNTSSPISSFKIINNSEIAMNFTMYYPKDEIVYIVYIKNKGNIPCEIIDIMESPNYNDIQYKNIIDPVTIKISQVKGKIIYPNESISLKIDVKYNQTNKEITQKSFNYKIGLITKSYNY